jgi:hypothetical protein
LVLDGSNLDISVSDFVGSSTKVSKIETKKVKLAAADRPLEIKDGITAR